MKKNISSVLGARVPTLRPFSTFHALVLTAILFKSLLPQLAISADALARSITLEIAPNTPLERALVRWGDETGMQVMMSADSVKKATTKGIRGTQSATRALSALLNGSGLSYSIDGNTVYIVPIQYQAQAPARPPTASDSAKKDPAGSDATQNARRTELQEVVVTAQKREERLQDVPVPVTAVSGETLLSTNQLRLQDYYSSVPGLNLSSSDFGWPQLTIRGLSTGGYTNPTVAIAVNDIPFGSSTALASGEEVPDIDPSDLARIEVLRGPQGTLYGASSLGGLVKFVTVDPSVTALSGSVQGSVSGITHGQDAAYSLRGAVNVPLSDTLAVRASVFGRRDPGYVDNILTGQHDVNRVNAQGGRLSGLWRPVDTFSLKLTALVQHSTADGIASVDVGPGFGPLQQSFIRGTGENSRTLEACSATINAKLGPIDLVSLTGYNINRFFDSFDASYLIGDGSAVYEHNATKKVSQEIRLSQSIGSMFDWLAGLYYTRENTHYFESIVTAVPETGVWTGVILDEGTPNSFKEYAGFADITWHLNERFDVQLGARQSHNEQSLTQIFFPDTALPEVRTHDSSFTYLVTPRYKFSPELMLYARFASGYRPGGPNFFVGPTVPAQYSADTTRNYELGVKGELLDRTLSYDASVYYIDWRDIQLQLLDPSANTFYANGSKAKSQGFELSVQSHPTVYTTVGAWLSWNDAVLTQDLPDNSSVVGTSGDRLPNTSRWSANVSLEQRFPLVGETLGFVGAAGSFVGDRLGVFTGTGDRQRFPSYTKLDFRSGVIHGSWSVTLFVNNLSDQRGVLAGGLGTYDPRLFNFIQPRTFGLTASKSF